MRKIDPKNLRAAAASVAVRVAGSEPLHCAIGCATHGTAAVGPRRVVEACECVRRLVDVDELCARHAPQLGKRLGRGVQTGRIEDAHVKREPTGRHLLEARVAAQLEITLPRAGGLVAAHILRADAAGRGQRRQPWLPILVDCGDDRIEVRQQVWLEAHEVKQCAALAGDRKAAPLKQRRYLLLPVELLYAVAAIGRIEGRGRSPPTVQARKTPDRHRCADAHEDMSIDGHGAGEWVAHGCEAHCAPNGT